MRVIEKASYIALAIVVLALMLLMFGPPAKAQNAANASSGAQAISNSASGSYAGNSWSSNSNYQAKDNTPSVGIGGGSPSPRTCAANIGAGVSGPGFGVGFSFPTAMRGCSVERAFNMVGRIPGLSSPVKRDALTQVACQDRFAGRALVAAGQDCRVGRFANRVSQRPGRVAARPARGTAAVATNDGGYWWTSRCTARQQVIYINGVEKPCR